MAIISRFDEHPDISGQFISRLFSTVYDTQCKIYQGMKHESVRSQLLCGWGDGDQFGGTDAEGEQRSAAVNRRK